MDITIKLVLKWTLLVSLNAIASFIAALLSGHDSLIKIAAMLAGIFTFILIYTLIEAWAEMRQMKSFLRSLKVGVIVKMVLQLIPAIEIFTGMFIVWSIEQVGVKNVFFATYLKTVGTGVILSCVVFVITAVHSYITSRRLKLNASTVNAQI